MLALITGTKTKLYLQQIAVKVKSSLLVYARNNIIIKTVIRSNAKDHHLNYALLQIVVYNTSHYGSHLGISQ